MEILDPDLWNEDGTPKRPSQEYMDSLEEAQRGAGCDACAGMLAGLCTKCGTRVMPNEANSAYLNYARIKREAKAQRPPEVGDLAHFWNDDTCYAAIVMETESFGHGACLRVHIPRKPFEDWQAEHDETKGTAETWHWPCGEGQ